MNRAVQEMIHTLNDKGEYYCKLNSTVYFISNDGVVTTIKYDTID